MIMRILVDISAVTGFALSTAFLALFRPKQILKPPAVNAVGFVIIVWLLIVSNLFLSIANGGFVRQYDTSAQNIVYLVARIIVDTLLGYRLVSFLKYRNTYDKANSRTG